MWGRRITYLIALAGGLVFYGFYREWFSWILLLTIVLLPWFSLALSLPAMLTLKASLRCPGSVRMGVPARTALQLNCKFPTPPVRGRIRLHNSLTDARFVGLPGELIPTEHCGAVTISYDRLSVYDYLGLFRRQLNRGDTTTVYVEPKPIPAQMPPSLEATRVVNAWKPKSGGGFSENHDLRLYRPGDDLRHIHWKLAAKTGKLIFREPIEPVQKGHLLTLTLCGSPEKLDEKLGQLLWVSTYLLEKHQSHAVRCQTGKGLVDFSVNDKDNLLEGLHALLRSCPAQGEVDPGQQDVLWQFHIGDN